MRRIDLGTDKEDVPPLRKGERAHLKVYIEARGRSCGLKALTMAWETTGAEKAVAERLAGMCSMKNYPGGLVVDHVFYHVEAEDAKKTFRGVAQGVGTYTEVRDRAIRLMQRAAQAYEDEHAGLPPVPKWM